MRRAAWRGPVAGTLLGLTLGYAVGISSSRTWWQRAATPVKASSLGLTAVSFADLPGWRDDDVARAMPALRDACTRIATSGPVGGADETVRLGGGPARWQQACRAAAVVATDAGARPFFETWFTPYAVSDAAAGASEGLFTGYYEPEVAGSTTASSEFAVPLFATPPDLVQLALAPFAADLQDRRVWGRVENGTLVPYHDRAAIDSGALAGRGLELLWLADPVDAFVLEIQGSGRVRLPDATIVRVTYAGQNGRPYVPIGRVLMEQGALTREAVSMPAIRTWLAAHPNQARAMMEQNPSYVFFRRAGELGPDQGPPGALGVSLTPGRSAAVDRAFLPLGAPLFVSTTDPLDGKPLRRLFVAADIGGAIKGPVRADLFWGWDPDAERRAGRMRARGRAWLLLPRQPA